MRARAGTRLRLRVRAGARRDAVLGAHGGALELNVTAPAEKGKANRAVLRLLGEVLGTASSSIELVSGDASPDKTVLVPCSPEEVVERLRALGS